LKAITLRNLPGEVARVIKRRAADRRISLNRAVIELLEEALGLRKSRVRLHGDLDVFAGTWTKEEADQFDRALADQRAVDPELWK
jgi:hypothetical protein